MLQIQDFDSALPAALLNAELCAHEGNSTVNHQYVS